MKRRDFVSGLALAAGAAGCSTESGNSETGSGNAGNGISTVAFKWNMVTAWPPGLPGLGVGAEKLAARIETASAGRITIKVFAGGELVPPLEVFDAVRNGAAHMGHDSAYYHRGKVPAAQYFTTVPFGLNVNEMNAWLYYGGGLELWQELYEPYGLVPFPAGNTGAQMLGWFNRKIETVADLAGLKMRMPGMGGEILQRAGATQVTIPAAEIFTSLQTGAIDAAEWVGPYNDIALGLHKAARYYYYPGFHEPGPNIECIINRDAWLSLPADMQEIVRIACQAAAMDIVSEYMWGNAMALEQIRLDPNVELKELPQSVFDVLREHANDAIEAQSANDEWSARLQESVFDFMEKSSAYQKVSELAYLNLRLGST